MIKKYSFSKLMSRDQELRSERSEWEAEWRSVSEYLLPGRGVYTNFAKPRKRKLTSPKVINTVAEDAMYVLTSGMHGRLTSPASPWFKLQWRNAEWNYYEPLKAWLQQCEKLIHEALHASNFYAVINSFYIEYVGFGTGSIYVGEDTGDDLLPFRFELLTAGEYSFSTGADGKTDTFFRNIFMTPRQYVERFPDTASKDMKRKVSEGQSGIDTTYLTILEATIKDKYDDERPFTKIYYEVTSTGNRNSAARDENQDPLERSGYYEFPYPTARWNTIGSDVYGIGPGSRALPDIKRLQEMEKSFLMAAHKSLDPPLNAPGRMRNKINSLPGGRNYYSNPSEVVSELYQVRFDFQGVSAAIERVEERIQRNFFNDIFLTGSRDPNATPYKATEVNAREQEKMLRLGPVVERLQHEFLQPVIERCFNIMLRKGMMPPLSPELAEMAGEYEINLISPMATAQKMVALQGINSFMAFLGQAAQFDQSILDNLDSDMAAREYANINGVDLGILRSEEDVAGIRKQRQEAQQAQQKQEEAMVGAQVAAEIDGTQAAAAKDQATAGLTQVQAQTEAMDAGLL